MKTTRTQFEYWTTFLWISFAAIFAFFALGSAVSVPWGNTRIPVSEVVGSIDWSRVVHLYTNHYFVVFAIAGCLVMFYTLASSWRWRFAFMLLGLITPVIVIDPEIAIMILLAPPAAVAALLGHVDGEFYVEDIPEAAALGLWMLLCLLFAAHQLLRARGQFLRSKAQLAD